MFQILRKENNRGKRKKMAENKEIKLLPIVMGIVFTAVGLTYLLSGFNIIPNTIPIIGFLDDGFVIIGLWLIFARLKKAMK